MATVNFLYRSKRESGFLTLRLLYTDDSVNYAISAKTKLEVSKKYWTKQHNTKSRDITISNLRKETYEELNRIDNHIIKEFHNTLAPAQVTKQLLAQWVENYYSPDKGVKEIPTHLIKFIDYFLEQKRIDLRPGSLQKYKVIKHKLERFEKSLKKTILISDVNEDFKHLFHTYCKGENYSSNTISKELASIKTFCKFARSKGLEVHRELDELKLNKEKTDTIYLSFEEIKQIETAHLDKPHLINAREWLIISCFTGQRISDFMRFTKKMIRIENGDTFIEFKQKKTGKLMTIPLTKEVQAVLDNNDGEFPASISDQHYNRHVKEVCKIAEIDEEVYGGKSINVSNNPAENQFRKVQGLYPKHELVASHIGRRSFATNHYGTVPTTLLIYMTGHSSEAMFLNYIGKSNKDMALEAAKYFK